MRTLWRFLFKGFLSVFGLSLGVVLAVITVGMFLTTILSSNTSQLVSFPDAQGEIRDLGKTAPIIFNLELREPIASSRQTAKMIQQALLGLEEAPFKGRVQGIIIDMDCPGGEVFEIDRVYSLLKTWKERTQLPIYVFVNGLCASGGYYIACAADKIYSTSNSLIGSIGVLSGPFFNVKEGLNEYGVETDLLVAGTDKAPMNPFNPWNEEQKESRQAILNFLYEQFVDIVVENRSKISKEKLVDVLGARLFPPLVALSEDLIDVANATRRKVFDDLAREQGIDHNYRVVGFSQDGLLRKIKMSIANSPVLTGKVDLTTSHEKLYQYSY